MFFLKIWLNPAPVFLKNIGFSARIVNNFFCQFVPSQSLAAHNRIGKRRLGMPDST
jgi:hypothetical protein